MDPRICIVDGYVDEPTCFGVSPYIAPYVRELAGCLTALGVAEPDIFYTTIDAVREHPLGLASLVAYERVFLVTSFTVPGRYLGGSPLTDREIDEIVRVHPRNTYLIGNIVKGYTITGGRAARMLDLSRFAGTSRIVRFDKLAEWLGATGVAPDNPAARGAFIVSSHPRFPDVICEIETYTGCTKESFCPFCTEIFSAGTEFRPVDRIAGEVRALAELGVRAFRLGKQPCLFSYGASPAKPIWRPDPAAVRGLYEAVRRAAPDLHVLHLDNVNPMLYAHFPKEASEITRTVAELNTPGDIAAFGVESFDETVFHENKLKVLADQAVDAVRLCNEHGGGRDADGVCRFLPGINILYGLPGESARTFDDNLNGLRRIMGEGLLLRRINVRQVMTFPGTKLRAHKVKISKKQMNKFKAALREEIEQPMLRKVFPPGTILRDVIIEKHEGNTSFGRQLGTYPILVGMPGVLPLYSKTDACVHDHGYRSITGFPLGLDVNHAERSTLERLPGIGRGRATELVLNRPFRDVSHAVAACPFLADFPFIQHLSFKL